MTATCIYGGRPSGKFNFTELHGWSNIPQKHFGDPIKDKQNYPRTPPPPFRLEVVGYMSTGFTEINKIRYLKTLVNPRNLM